MHEDELEAEFLSVTPGAGLSPLHRTQHHCMLYFAELNALFASHPQLQWLPGRHA